MPPFATPCTPQHFNGYFDSPEEAGRVYDMKLIELHGDEAGEGPLV